MPGYQIPPWGRPPAAPLATVVVHGKILGRDTTEPVRALLDSGADYTEIPLGVARRLGLRRSGERQIDGRPTPDPTYFARIELERRIFEVVVIATDEFKVNGEIWGLIGRDILNEAVVLDGPRRTYEVAPTISGAT
jgi:hypothetical protein